METNQTPQQIADARFAAWDVPALPYADQVQWFQDQLIPHLIGILLERDLVELMVIAEPIADAVKAALIDPYIPGPDHEFVQMLRPEIQPMFADELSRATMAEDLRQIAGRIQTLTPSEMAVRDVAASSEGDQFIRVVTRSARVRESFYLWGSEQGTGFLDFLKSTNPLAMPTFNELRMLYFIDRLLEHREAGRINLRQAQAGPGAFR